ncbi:MAG: response regulator [Paludibacter sp.]|nr:response regulator [Paludibacter sp.]
MKSFTIIVCALLVQNFLFSQTDKIFTVDNALSSSLINAIYQDSHYYLWIATEDGLNKYDGNKFIVYRNIKGNNNSLKNNYVRSLYEDSKGRFWIGCVNGIMLYDRGTDSFTEVPLFNKKKIMETHVSSIIETKAGDIIISTSNDAVLRFDSATSSFHVDLKLLPRLCSHYIVSVFEDSNQNLWIASADNGVNRYNHKTNKIDLFKAPESLGNNQISSINQDVDGNIFIGTLAGGLFMLKPGAVSFVPVPYNGAFTLPIKSLFVDSNNRLLIGTDGQGVKVFNKQRFSIEDFEIQTAAFNFSTTKVHSIMTDRAGNLWFGLFQKGLYLKPKQSNSFNYIGNKSYRNNLIGDNCVMSVFKDLNQALWIGTDHDGLYKVEKSGLAKHFPIKSNTGLILTTIMSIVDQDVHSLWLGSYLDGLMLFNKNTGITTRFANNLAVTKPSSNRVISICKISENVLWVGTNGSGIQQFDIVSKKFVRQLTSDDSGRNKLINNWINCIIKDRNGYIWVGSYGGVNKINLTTGKIQTYIREEGFLLSNIVYSIAVDNNEIMWFGTSDGLTRFDPKTEKSTHYTASNGLSSNVIRSIAVDENENLWLGTNLGLSKFEINSEKFSNYYSFDGLQSNEFTLGAVSKANTGELIFGGVGGVSTFFPSSINYKNDSLRTYLTSINIVDKVVVMGMKSGRHNIIDKSVNNVDRINLSYNDNIFSLEFSTFKFGLSERVYYKYKLEGLNAGWMSTELGVSKITFNNLDYGTYTLKVRAVLNENVSPEKVIFIHIYPPWYLTNIAKFIYFVLLLLVFYFIYKFVSERINHKHELMRREHIEQLNESKLQFFINISHEIRTPMTLILSPLEKLISDNDNPEKQQSYQLMYRNAQRILRLINQLLDLRKIDKGQLFVKMQEVNLVEFIADVMKTFEYQSKKRNIRFTLTHKIKQEAAWIDYNNFDKILVNLLSNAFKFTPENGEISIRLTQLENKNTLGSLKDYFEIIVADNGPGIDEDKLDKVFERFYQIDHVQNNFNFGTGIGLHLTRILVDMHHGTIYARNKTEGEGTEFVVHIPVGRAHLQPNELANSDSLKDVANVKRPELNSIDESMPVFQPMKRKSKSKPTILLVDDEPEIRQYLSQNLADKYLITQAANGREALDMILIEKPDLVISDVMMPEMDGIQLCKKIKSNTNVKHIPVILLTAKTSDDDKAEGYDIGADAYIGKPFNISLLKKRVANILENRDRLEPKMADTKENKELINQVVLKSSDQIIVEKVIAIINKNIDNPELNVEMLAEGIGFSRVHMHRKLKELTNMSARDYIRSIRMKQAENLILGQKLCVSEVAYALGFNNLSHFSTTFRDFYGMSPTDFVKQNTPIKED